jgi:tetrahydromethanopterin S-methyltransferase subunit G
MVEMEEEALSVKDLPILKPHLLSEKMGAFRIERKGDKLVVAGKRLEQFTQMTDFSNAGARQRFGDVVGRIGLLKALEKLQQPDDSIYIGDKKVDEYIR